jgi:hypothetical protein
MDIARPRSELGEHRVVDFGQAFATFGEHLEDMLGGMGKNAEVLQDEGERKNPMKEITEFIDEHSLRRLVGQGGVEVRGAEEDAPGQSVNPFITNCADAYKVIEPVIAVQNWVGRKTD